MRLEHHLVGGYVRYISPYIIIIIINIELGHNWPSTDLPVLQQWAGAGKRNWPSSGLYRGLELAPFM